MDISENIKPYSSIYIYYPCCEMKLQSPKAIDVSK
jgi:hypothetical protein